MTEKEYAKLVKDMSPKSPIVKDCVFAFLIGGLICVLGQAIRNGWSAAGLNPEDFRLVTTYENSRFSKPNPRYYEDLLTQLGVAPEECLMIGNDADEDMIAESLGMKVFLLTDHLINRNGADISAYPNGNFSDLISYIDSL